MGNNNIEHNNKTLRKPILVLQILFLRRPNSSTYSQYHPIEHSMHHESENLAPPGPSADNSKPVELETQYYRHRLSKPEIFWRDQSLWLNENGYQLRPRYHPEWVPSWREDKERNWISEDGQPMQVSGVKGGRTFQFPRQPMLTTYRNQPQYSGVSR